MKRTFSLVVSGFVFALSSAIHTTSFAQAPTKTFGIYNNPPATAQPAAGAGAGAAATPQGAGAGAIAGSTNAAGTQSGAGAGAITNGNAAAAGAEAATVNSAGAPTGAAGAGAVATPQGAAAQAGAVAAPAPAPVQQQPPPQQYYQPAPQPQQQVVAAQPQSDGSAQKTEGVFGKFLIGPTIGFFFPVPLTIGLEAKWDSLLDLSFESGSLPTTSIYRSKVQADTIRTVVRVFPFREAFFVGLGVGNQNVKATRTENVSGTDVTATVSVSTPYLTPMVGWKWLYESGFFFGVELGYQFQTNSTVTVTNDGSSALTSTTQYQDAEQQAKDAGYKIGQLSLPHLAIIQIGYFF